MKRKQILAFVMIAILSISITVFAVVDVEKIEAYLVNDLKFDVDGEAWSPKDVDGSPLTPLNYNGRTYVPVRSLLEHKGVLVGYDEPSRTVSLDFSKIEITYNAPSKDLDNPLFNPPPRDLNNPLFMETVATSGGGAGKATFKEFTLSRNPDFDLGNISMTQEYSFDLETDTTIFIGNRRVEGSLDEIMKQAESWTMKSVTVSIDETTGEVTSIMIMPPSDSDSDAELLRKVDIEIEVSGPPWKLTIRIRF